MEKDDDFRVIFARRTVRRYGVTAALLVPLARSVAGHTSGSLRFRDISLMEAVFL